MLLHRMYVSDHLSLLLLQILLLLLQRHWLLWSCEVRIGWGWHLLHLSIHAHSFVAPHLRHFVGFRVDVIALIVVQTSGSLHCGSSRLHFMLQLRRITYFKVHVFGRHHFLLIFALGASFSRSRAVRSVDICVALWRYIGYSCASKFVALKTIRLVISLKLRLLILNELILLLLSLSNSLVSSILSGVELLDLINLVVPWGVSCGRWLLSHLPFLVL